MTQVIEFYVLDLRERGKIRDFGKFIAFTVACLLFIKKNYHVLPNAGFLRTAIEIVIF